jgi:hypothetical protein
MWVKVFIQRECSGSKTENELHRHDNIATPGWGEQFRFFKRAALVAIRIWNYNQRA